jgi:hypothetical protein
MTGGEIHPERREVMLKLRKLIMAEPDVILLHALAPLKGGRWAYLIQTPFASFPNFVMGTTDDENTQPIILAKAAKEWGIRQSFNELTERLS